jgi:hypothetical protein
MKTRNRFSFAIALLLTVPAASAFADFGQNVECQGNCNQVNLTQVCQAQNFFPPGTTPVTVSCDDTVKLITGDLCGSNGARCHRTTLNGNLLLAAFCEDRTGGDATVTCR